MARRSLRRSLGCLLLALAAAAPAVQAGPAGPAAHPAQPVAPATTPLPVLVVSPFGQGWAIATKQKDMTHEEMQRAFEVEMARMSDTAKTPQP